MVRLLILMGSYFLLIYTNCMASKHYDIGIGWASAVDETFVSLLKKECAKHNLSVDEVTYQNLREKFNAIKTGDIQYRWYLDRSSLDYSAYCYLSWLLTERGTVVVNNPDSVIAWGSKIELHRACETRGIPVPKTHIIHTSTEAKKTAGSVVKDFSAPFVIKPAYGGYEGDVLLTGSTKEDITTFLDNKGTDMALVQEFVTPTRIAGRAGWFRPLYVCGEVLPIRWNPINTFYEKLGDSPEEQGVRDICHTIMRTIHSITGFDLFSAEIVFTGSTEFVVVDYANQPVDLNVREKSADALPKETLSTVAEIIVRGIVSA
jgi:hypothetical protein